MGDSYDDKLELERHLQETGPHHLADADMAPEAEARLRRELRDGFARRRATRRKWLIATAACAVVFVGLVAFQPDVGSDGFGVKYLREATQGRPTVETEFLDERYGSPLDSTHTMEEHLRAVSGAHEAKMAGAWKVGGIFGWTLRGRTGFTITYDVEIEGRTVNYHVMWPKPSSPEFERDKEDFYGKRQPELLADIDAGRNVGIAPATRDIDGVEYVFDRWAATYPEWGEVVVWEARIPD